MVGYGPTNMTENVFKGVQFCFEKLEIWKMYEVKLKFVTYVCKYLFDDLYTLGENHYFP